MFSSRLSSDKWWENVRSHSYHTIKNLKGSFFESVFDRNSNTEDDTLRGKFYDLGFSLLWEMKCLNAEVIEYFLVSHQNEKWISPGNG